MEADCNEVSVDDENGEACEDTIRKLGRWVIEALRAEDMDLRKRLGAQPWEKHADEPAGLTYWLYETTLVYLIFKAWAPHHYVKWDWEKNGHGTGVRREEPTSKPHGAIDLVVHAGQPLAFEAKWWMNPKAQRSIEKTDMKKLKEWLADKPTARAFLLGLWWEYAGADEEKALKEADAWCNGQGLALRYRAWIPTAGPRSETKQRRFYLDIMEIKQSQAT